MNDFSGSKFQTHFNFVLSRFIECFARVQCHGYLLRLLISMKNYPERLPAAFVPAAFVPAAFVPAAFVPGPLAPLAP
jgi:hypothetical protein